MELSVNHWDTLHHYGKVSAPSYFCNTGAPHIQMLCVFWSLEDAAKSDPIWELSLV
jgi:hypothetical protein